MKPHYFEQDEPDSDDALWETTKRRKRTMKIWEKAMVFAALACVIAGYFIITV